MTIKTQKKPKQRGAALIIVLILVATLSFIVLSVAHQTTLAANRGLNIAVRQELFWRAIGAETLAATVLERAFRDENIKITPDNPLFSTNYDLPMADGEGKVFIEDQTACFNVNSLGDPETRNTAKTEFLTIAQSLNINTGEAQSIVSGVMDWIDTDSNTEPGGAEDGFYSALPVPYRTGGTLLADISEMRAMSGISREIFKTLRPFLCALPEAGPSIININFLTPERAPLLVGVTMGKLDNIGAVNLIQARPPGGFGSVEEFLALVEKQQDEPMEGLQGRVSVTSRYVRSFSTLELGPGQMELSATFSIDDKGQPTLIARQFGATK